MSVLSNAQSGVAVEWAPFVKNEGVSDEQLMIAADRVQSTFLSKQPGFIKRELIKKNETEYADLLHWASQSQAMSAGEKVFSCVQCNDYFKLMNMEASTSAGSGFSHYTILKTWN